MPIPPGVRLGPLSQIVSANASWDDDYPGWQAYADELETLLGFLKQAAQFERFLPRLQARKKERNSALNEIRVALHLQSSGFPVVNWEAAGEGKTTGEFPVGVGGFQPIFLEVKGPTWEAELSQGERLRGRTRQPKYINGEGGAFDNSEWIRFAVDKAYSKFSASSPNLLVIADDLFVSLQHGTDMFAKKALHEARHGGYFAKSDYEHIGGVGIFWNEVVDLRVAYELRLYINPRALDACRLPNQFVEGMGRRPTP